MFQAPATRPKRSVERLYEQIKRDLGSGERDVEPERLLDVFRRYADRYDTDVNSPYNLGYYCIDADLASLAALEETDRRAANIVVLGQHPASHAFEKLSIDILLEAFGIDPKKGHGHYTSCGTESNNTALIVAVSDKLSHRHLAPGDYDPALSADGNGRPQPYEFVRHGLLPLKVRPAVYLTRQTADCVRKNVRNLLGIASLREVPVERNLGMDPKALEAIVASDRESGKYLPLYVAATVGSTGAGIVDPLERIGPVCKANGLWLHADAPWGGIAAFSPSMRKACLAGIGYADSITFDPHKTLVPLGSGGCGMFLTRHRNAVERAFNVTGRKAKDYDYGSMSLQGSRTTNGLRVLTALLRRNRLAGRVEREAALGDLLRRELRAAGWEIANDTPLPVVCTIHPKMRRGAFSAANAVDFLHARGIYAKASELRPGEPASLRLGVISRRTTEQTIREVVGCLKEFAAHKRAPKKTRA